MIRALVTGTGRVFFQEEAGEDVSTQYGKVAAETLEKAKDGDVVESSIGKQFVVYTPSFIDTYKRIKRGAQIIKIKDAGVILETCGLGEESVVAEAGSGSGALTILLARRCKKVYSYDNRKEHQEVAEENVNRFGFTNVDFKIHDIGKGLPDGPVDALILDLPEPWHAFADRKNLKIGSYVVTYLPSTVQVKQAKDAAEQAGLFHVKTIEVTERYWTVTGDAVRPTSKNVGFTAFLSFYRYFGEDWGGIRPKDKVPVQTEESIPPIQFHT